MAGQQTGFSSTSRWFRPTPGFAPHAPAIKHRYGAKLLGATMWFWILYRAKQDGAVLLVSGSEERRIEWRSGVCAACGRG
jgi:hypothetical protein